ncbi:MAG: nucleotide pyrophosphatase/phosphodiesterase family protein [Planctomycetota bacterium]
MKKVLVLNVVGLSPRHLGPHTPHLSALAEQGFAAPLQGVLPALTCSAQSTMLTGAPPKDHGIVGNGWYFRDLAQVWLWRQSNHLVKGEKLWDVARKRNKHCTTMNMFWWYNMYANVDWYLTPRPLYMADGRKLPGIYGAPADFRQEVEDKLSTFPLFDFWGPRAGIKSSRWITDATLYGMKAKDPTITLCYLPHLDYDLQRFGPRDARIDRALKEVDACAGKLIDYARESGREILVVSEYGISEVRDAVHINRALRQAGFLATTPKLSGEDLDAGASRAFAVADHQIAHVYVKNLEDQAAVKSLLENLDGVERVLDRREQSLFGIDHQRSGEFVAISDSDRWFSYYFWLDDAKAPDYARTVDIHSKPGYDPVELFTDPEIKALPLRIAGKILKKKLGFRMTMNVIPLETRFVKGSHGRLETKPADGPIIICSRATDVEPRFEMQDIRDCILELADLG